MPLRSPIIIAGLTVMLLSSCASTRTPDEIRATEPECEKAQQQLAMLDGEMVATHQRAIAGVSSVVPSLAVLSLLSGNYSTNVAIATGSYEEALDEKIQEIKVTCGLEDLTMESDALQEK